MKKVIFAAAIAALALVGCSRDAQVAGERTPVRFTTNVASYTVKATESALEDNDAVQIIAGAPINATSAATVNGTALEPETPIYWNSGQTASTNFVAIYPGAGQTATTMDDYSLANGDYAYHSSLLVASTTAAVNETVALEFKHPFSKIVIDITNNLGADAVASVSVNGVILQANMDFAAGTVDLGQNTAANVSATKISQTEEKWAAIIFPQTAKPSIVVTTAQGSVYTFALSADYTFKAGEVATAALTLNGGASHSGDEHGAAVGFSFTVKDWAAASENVAVGDAAVEVSTTYWYIEGTVNGASWGTAFPMVMKADKVWTVDFTYNGFDANDPATEVASAGFKLHQGPGWDGTQIGADPANQVFTVDGNINWGWKTANADIKLAANGTYTLTYDYTDGDKVTITPKN